MKRILLFPLAIFAWLNLVAQNPMQVAECDFDGVMVNCEFLFDTSLQNIWQIGTPQKPFFGNALSVPHAIQTDSINSYPVNNHSVFILKFANNTVDATDWNRTELSFWHKYQMNALLDSGFIDYSIDNGLTWISMKDTYNVQGTNGWFYSFFFWESPLLQTPAPSLNENVVSGISSDWVFSSYEWFWFLSVETNRDNFTPDTMQVRFSFNTDGLFDNYDGWIIDNIKVEKQWYSGTHSPENNPGTLQLYPNPASTVASFAYTGREIPQVQQVINMHGEVVKEYYMHNHQGKILLDHVPAGNYLFRIISSSGHSAVQWLIVQ